MTGSDDAEVRVDRQRPYLRLHHVTVFVRDQDRSLRFYLDQLGFNLVVDYRFRKRGRFVLVAPPDGTALLSLVAPGPGSEEYELIGHSRWVVLVAEDVVARYEAWCDRGVRFRHPPQPTPWGGIVTTFEDVDGNQFALAGWDDLTREIEVQRRTVVERLEAERRASYELEIAKQVQARLFPQTAPPARTLEYAGLCIPARAVGGDYYDFLSLGESRIGLVIGDISGKGIAAALLMASLQANLRSQCAMASDQPQQFLQSVNQLFYETTTDSAYATLFFAAYDDRERRLCYASCGHLAALLFRHNGPIERLESTGTVLGMFRTWGGSIEERTLGPGDTLVLYTDGISEAFNEAGEEFGEDRLLQPLQRHPELPARELVTVVLDSVRRFSPGEQHDDMTLIIARCKAGENC